MPRKIYNKLISDKIPQIIRKAGHTPEVSVMDDADFRKTLKIKMTEDRGGFEEKLFLEYVDEIS